MNDETKQVEIVTKDEKDLTEEDKGIIIRDLVTRFIKLDSAMKYNFLGNINMLLLKHIDNLESKINIEKEPKNVDINNTINND